MSTIISIALRGAQITFAAVVFGLSVHLVRQQISGNAPISLGYASFVGAASLVGAFLGMAGNFIESLQGIIGLIVDGFLILANLAGGVLLAVQLQGAKCDNVIENLLTKNENSVLFAGCGGNSETNEKCLRFYGKMDPKDRLKFLEGRCQAATADTAFMFLTLIVVAAATTLIFLHRRR